MNYLWGIMLLVGIGFGTLTGNLQAVTDQALASAKEAVSLSITMFGVMGFWCGVMEIAEKSGILEKLTRLLQPIVLFLFPSLSKEDRAIRPIATNMAANILGLGWAATPAGLEAMQELAKKENLDEKANIQGMASDAMCDFLILNISSLQLIPVTVIAYRSQYGSVNPTYIVGPAIVATAMSTLAAVVFIKARKSLGGRLCK